MNQPDYDDPDVEEYWCMARRAELETYLRRQGLVHGDIGDWPAWRLAPHVSLWAVESARHPGTRGWWAVCGDVPSDYMPADVIGQPRMALRAFGERWLRIVRGEESCGARVSRELYPMLETRGHALLRFADQDAVWEARY